MHCRTSVLLLHSCIINLRNRCVCCFHISDIFWITAVVDDLVIDDSPTLVMTHRAFDAETLLVDAFRPQSPLKAPAPQNSRRSY